MTRLSLIDENSSLKVYPDIYFYRIDYLLYEGGAYKSQVAFLYNQVPFTPDGIKAVIRELIKKPDAVITISVEQFIDRDTYMAYVGHLPVGI